jgi:hypothetical protein
MNFNESQKSMWHRFSLMAGLGIRLHKFSTPKVHQHTRARDRRLKQRLRTEAKRILKADKRLKVVKI